MYSEFDVRMEISRIEESPDSPITKARRLLILIQKIERFGRRLTQGVDILAADQEDEAAQRLAETERCLRRLQEDARLAAYRVLKPDDEHLGFDTAKQAYPFAWVETGKQLKAELI